MSLGSRLRSSKKIKGFHLINLFNKNQKLFKIISNKNFSNTGYKNHNPDSKIPSYLDALNHLERPAIKDKDGLHTYQELITKATRLSTEISKLSSNSNNKFVSILCPHSSSYVVSMWAGWLSGCVVVPLSLKHPPAMLQYFLEDSRSEVLISSYRHLADKLKRSNKKLKVLRLDEIVENLKPKDDKEISNSHWLEAREKSQSESWKDLSALVVYTSGTSGQPKGVLHSHGSIGRMVGGMVEDWGWVKDDVIINSLPFHHVHGIINALLTPLMVGALCIMSDFKAPVIWDLLLGKNGADDDLTRKPTVMMGVPTMYSMLIDELMRKSREIAREGSGADSSSSGSDDDDSDTKRAGHDNDFAGSGDNFLKSVKDVCSKNIRLFVSGSAPLQLPVMQKWEELTGHVLLERYGMTELGMVLGNPLIGKRIPGTVGNPFPFVEVAIARGVGESDSVSKNSGQLKDPPDLLVKGDKNGTVVLDDSEREGELLVRGGTLFQGYLNLPAATAKEFTKDGWFRTGDTASYDSHNGVYSILGRTSVDVIKSGGYKLSAIQIENVLLQHESIAEVAVVGVEDEKWGQMVAAVVVVVAQKDGDGSSGGDGNGGGSSSSIGGNGSSSSIGGGGLSLESLREWCQDRMSAYQIPSLLRVVASLDRNAMGKVNKKDLIKKYFK